MRPVFYLRVLPGRSAPCARQASTKTARYGVHEALRSRTGCAPTEDAQHFAGWRAMAMQMVEPSPSERAEVSLACLKRKQTADAAGFYPRALLGRSAPCARQAATKTARYGVHEALRSRTGCAPTEGAQHFAGWRAMAMQMVEPSPSERAEVSLACLKRKQTADAAGFYPRALLGRSAPCARQAATKTARYGVHEALRSRTGCAPTEDAQRAVLT